MVLAASLVLVLPESSAPAIAGGCFPDLNKTVT
jgi:hypothetical protein